MTRASTPTILISALSLALCVACSDDGELTTVAQTETDTGGDGEPTGDGDGEPAGDGEPTGDGDPAGDGDPGGDGDPSGDGDGDPAGDGDGDPSGDGDPGVEGQDYREAGPYAFSSMSASMQVTQQCDLDYVVYTPDQPASDVPVLLAHGFSRSVADMAPTAEHLASWGVTTIVVPLCTNGFSIDHPRNGEAMAALGEALAPNGAVYSGFSAGGLAAFVAAAEAQNAVAYIGLDSVDNAGLAAGLAGPFPVPVRAIAGVAESCNDNNNFLPIYAGMSDTLAIRVVGAHHFDFETDACGFGDFGCSFCAPAGPTTRALVLGLVTAAALVETGADLGGESWWDPGSEWFDMFASATAIQLL